jgi:hypothetical protein
VKKLFYFFSVVSIFSLGYWFGANTANNIATTHSENNIVSSADSPIMPINVNRLVDQQIEKSKVSFSAATSSTEKNNLLHAIELLGNKKPSPMRETERVDLIIRLAQVDPQLAMSMAQSVEKNSVASTISTVLKMWAATDADAALAWVESTNKDPSQTYNYDTVLEIIAQTNSDKAIKYAEKLASAYPEQASGIYNNIVNGMANQGDFDAIKNWVGALSVDNETRAGLVNTAANVWAKYEPTKAAEWVLSLSEAERILPLGGLASSWATEDPAAATQFGAQIANRENKQRFLENTIPAWIMADPKAANGWLKSQDNYHDFDKAILDSTTESQLAFKDPKLAATLIENIKGGEDRLTGFKHLMIGFKANGLVNDGIVYANSIAGINDEQRQELLRSLQ